MKMKIQQQNEIKIQEHHKNLTGGSLKQSNIAGSF